MSNKTVEELIRTIESPSSGLDTQLDAIKRLGGLKSKNAADYLNRINHEDTTEERRGDENRYAWPNHLSFIENVSHPHTKGELHSALCTRTGYDESSNTPGAYPMQHSPYYDRAKKVLDKAVRRVSERERQAVRPIPMSRSRALWYFISGR